MGHRLWLIGGPRRRRRAMSSEDSAEESALAAIVRSSQDAVIAKTVDGIITEWNGGATAIYGLAAEQMIGQSIEVTIPPEWLEQERVRHARVAAGASESGYRCTRLRADGRPIEVVMSMSPLYGARGLVIGVASISRPVSEGERADARFASLLEGAPDAIMCVDRSGRIAIVNAQVSIIFGYSRAELIGAEIEMLLPAALRKEHHRHRENFVRNPLTRTMGAGLSLSGRRRDGSAFPVEVSLAADRTGGDSMVIAAVRDVSEQRATAAALRENESRLRQLAESVDVVFALKQLDPPGYLYVSPGSRTVLGREPEAIMANPDLLTQAVHPQDRERVERDYLPAVFAGRPAQSEHRILTAGGQVRWLHFSATPVPNPLGPAVRSVVTVEDVTDRVKAAHALRDAEAAARAANEAKNQFLSRMSHELRTPLNAVLGFGQLLQRQLADTEHSEAISYVLKGGRHLLDLINDVLDIARIESGDMSISSEPVPVASVVEETIQLMQPLAESAGVTLTVDVGSPDEYMLADRQRLRQILLNLLSNAIKYNHPGGHAWVGWETSGDQAILLVRDDGPGIRQELQSRLFTPFDRLGAELSAVDGTGIGLALTRSLTEMMGGSITVESALGKGALVTVTMKSATAASPEIRADDGHSEAGAAVTDISPVTLLYIEDNAPNVLLVEHLIRLRPEWRLVHSALGSLGIELAEAHHPDLILLDLHLPDLSGREVLGALKRRPEFADTPVVILTADASAGQSRRLIEAGAAGYLTKPLDLDEVLGYLDNIARNKELPAAG